MAIGNDPGQDELNSYAFAVAQAWGQVARQSLALQAYVVGLGTGGLEALGFSSGDATTMTTMCDYMGTLAGVYLGTVQQGGSGGTDASEFDFQNALVALTGPFSA